MAEILKIREITIDTMQHKEFNIKEAELKLIRFYQNDLNSAKLLINVTHDKVVTDFSSAISIQIAFLKPDCKRVFQDVQNVNQMQGKYYVVLSTQTLIAYGNVIAQLRFTFPNNKVIETCKFAFTVDESIMSDDAMKSTNEFPVIQKAIEAGKKFEGVDIDGIIAAGAKADGAVKRTGDTMTGNLTVPRLYAGPSPDKQANVGTGSSDVYLANTLSKKYLQLKDDGALLYSNVPIALSDTAQMKKITKDNGTQTISTSDPASDILLIIKNAGAGMNTIYCHGSVLNSVPSKASWRGISFLNADGYGLVLAKDFKGGFFTNYIDNGNWIGWVKHSDDSITQNVKLTNDDGQAHSCHKLDCNDLTTVGKYFGNELKNSPDGTTAYYLIETFQVANASSWVQHATRWSAPQQYYRTKVNTGNWSVWKELADKDKTVQKTGDTMDGPLKFSGINFVETNGSGLIQGGGSTAIRWRIYQSGNGELSFVPSATVGGADWEWNKAFRIKPDGSVSTPKDATIDLVITSDFTPTSGTVQNIVRRGNIVTLMLDVTRNADSTNPIVTTLPEGVRPIGSLTTDIASPDGTMSRLLIRFNGEIHLDTKGKRYRILQTFVTP